MAQLYIWAGCPELSVSVKRGQMKVTKPLTTVKELCISWLIGETVQCDDNNSFPIASQVAAWRHSRKEKTTFEENFT